MTDVDTRAREMADSALDSMPAQWLAALLAPLLARAEAAERERVIVQSSLETRNIYAAELKRRAMLAEARVAALRKALEPFAREWAAYSANPHIEEGQVGVPLSAYRNAAEALAADQAGGEDAGVSDARERLAAAPYDDVELPIGGEADKRIAVIARDWKDPALTPQPPQSEAGAVPDRDILGRIVREAWVKWAYTQPNPKPSWLLPYDKLSEPDKEADRQIGEAVLSAERDGEVRAAAPSPPSGEDRVKALEEALRPFARLAEDWDRVGARSRAVYLHISLTEFPADDSTATLNDLRRARALLARQP